MLYSADWSTLSASSISYSRRVIAPQVPRAVPALRQPRHDCVLREPEILNRGRLARSRGNPDPRRRIREVRRGTPITSTVTTMARLPGITLEPERWVIGQRRLVRERRMI